MVELCCPLRGEHGAHLLCRHLVRGSRTLDSRFSGVMSDFISTYLFMGFLSSCGVLDGFGVSEGCWFVWLDLYRVAFECGILLRGADPWTAAATKAA